MEFNVIQQFFPDKRVKEGMTYQRYLEMSKSELADTNSDNMTAEEKERSDIKKLNIQRMTRIDKSYEPGIDIRDEIEKIEDYQLWMVITENWCGDSAQNLPYIARIASLNQNIELKIILRDSNLDIMDNYLTAGTKSIPKFCLLYTSDAADEEDSVDFGGG